MKNDFTQNRYLVFRRRHILYCLIVLLGFVLGWFLLSSIVWHLCRGVEISPDEATFITPLKEGELVNVPLMMKNKCSIPHTIIKFGTSCSCTDLVTVKEKSVEDGMILLPHQTLLLQATVDTRSNEGDTSFDVWARYQVNRKTSICGCRINIHILPAIRLVTPLPPLIKYEKGEGQFSQTIFIGDAFPNSGIEIESVSSDLPDLVVCELIKIPDEIVYSGKDNLPEWQKLFRKRYAVKFSFDREKDSFETILTIKPKEKNYQSLFVPIHYEGSLKRPNVNPTEIVIPLHEVIKKVQRAVEVRIVPGKNKPVYDVSITSLPDGIVLKSKQKTHDGWLFQFTIDTAIANVNNSLIFEDENRQSCVTIPVLFVGSKK